MPPRNAAQQAVLYRSAPWLALPHFSLAQRATWLVCSGLVDAKTLGGSVYPLYDAALATGKLYVIVALFVGTIMACLASAKRAVSMTPAAHGLRCPGIHSSPGNFSKTHPKYRTPYRAVVFLLPISLAFAFTGLLDQVNYFLDFLCTIGVFLNRNYDDPVPQDVSSRRHKQRICCTGAPNPGYYCNYTGFGHTSWHVPGLLGQHALRLCLLSARVDMVY